MIPSILQKEIDKAQEALNVLKPLNHIASMKPRIAAATRLLGDLLGNAETLKGLNNKKYTDDQIQQVLDSGLCHKKGSMDHIALSIDVGMSYGSVMHFLKQREFCNGGAWHNTQTRVMVYMSRGDSLALTEMIERNKQGLEAYNKGEKQ